MVEGNTVLSYQMAYEMRLFDRMIHSEEMGNLSAAIGYGKIVASFLKVEKEKLPQMPISGKDYKETLESFQKYYFELLNAIITKVGINIDHIRATYGKSNDIPHIDRSRLRHTEVEVV